MAAGPVALPGASGNVFAYANTSATIFGYGVRETAGSSAVFRLRDASATGTVLVTVSLAANESTSDEWQPMGHVVPSGTLYFQLVSGAVEGTVFVR